MAAPWEENFPDGQESQEDLPAAPWKSPVGHGAQMDWPVAEVMVPATQSVQAVTLVLSAYVPMAHAEQADSALLGPYAPMGQSVQEARPGDSENFPARQSLHAVIWTKGAILPAAHMTHADWPVKPLY